jgi:inhibitor of KinA
MVGFSGGFPYLGFTHEKLYTERKQVPERSVPAGSVALAGNQTGIYPFESPGAWKIIGHTEFTVFDPKAKDPAIIKPGDKIRFVKA